MSKYKFIKHDMSGKGKFILLNKAIYLSVEARSLIKENRVDVYYDKQNGAIKLEPSENGYKISKQGSGYVISARTFSKIMPKGRYLMSDDPHDFIFTLEMEKNIVNLIKEGK